MAENRTLLFRVEDRSAGVRLDQLIPRVFPELSRSRVQKLIGSGLVTVNDLPAQKRYLSRTSDLLRVTLPEPEAAEHLPEEIPLVILYEDEDLLAVDKPPGMVVHPAPGHRGGTLVNALLHRVPTLSGIGGVRRPGIIHRLDKDTSGVVLVAKHDTAHHRLAAQFQRRRVNKTYLAAAAGRPAAEEGVCDLPIGRDRKDRKKISSRTATPRSAVTRWRLLRHLDGAALMELAPETGRTHQIRVHLAESGHPVLGDPVYGPKQRKGSAYHRTTEAYGFSGRLALHAWKIRFLHPGDRRPVAVESPLPAEFERLLEP